MYKIEDNIEGITGERLEAVIAQLPQWRQEVVRRYKFEGGRRESALAFRLLQRLVGEVFTDVDTNSIEFEIGEHGKPSLRNHPEVCFNISHCSHAVACIVDTVPVGIDIECRGRYKHSLAAYCMSEKEMEWITEMGDDAANAETDLRFTTLWTQKEALLKLIGTGICDDVKTVLEQYGDKVVLTTVAKETYVCTTARYK